MLGDLFGWRNVFFVLGAMFALATRVCSIELIADPRTRPTGRPAERSRGFAADYAAVLSNPWARFVILARVHRDRRSVGAPSPMSAPTSISASGLSFTAVGSIVGTFAIGGLIYAATVRQLVNRLGQRGWRSAARCCARSAI